MHHNFYMNALLYSSVTNWTNAPQLLNQCTVLLQHAELKDYPTITPSMHHTIPTSWETRIDHVMHSWRNYGTFLQFARLHGKSSLHMIQILELGFEVKVIIIFVIIVIIVFIKFVEVVINIKWLFWHKSNGPEMATCHHPIYPYTFSISQTAPPVVGGHFQNSPCTTRYRFPLQVPVT